MSFLHINMEKSSMLLLLLFEIFGSSFSDPTKCCLYDIHIDDQCCFEWHDRENDIQCNNKFWREYIGDNMCELCIPGTTIKADFDGPTCSKTCICEDIDECADTSTCANGATCNNFYGGFECICPKGYYGELCETNVCHPTPADVVFLLDSSVSMTEKQFKKQLEFVANFTDKVFIGPTDFQISVITFSFAAHIEFYLNNYTSKETLKAAIKDIPYKPGATFTHKAFEKVPIVFDPVNGGERNVKDRFPDRFVFLLTDGMSTYKSETRQMANVLKHIYPKRFKIFTIGIGNEVSHEELLDVASNPSLVYSAQDFDSLYTVLKNLVQMTCEGCRHSYDTHIGIFVDVSSNTDLGKFQDLRDALSFFVESIDIGVSKTQLSLTTFSSTISSVFRFSDSLDRHTTVFELNRLQLSETIGETIDIVQVLSHISRTYFNDVCRYSKCIAMIFSAGQIRVQSKLFLYNVKRDLLDQNITTVFVGTGNAVSLDSAFSVVNDAFDVYLMDPSNKRNLDALKSYTFYSVCSITND